ncbi:DUF7146 domain-containing protein [Tardiphaga sp. 839_C3_N1_4]|uniref:DUF7146 domain-containing protein n=1 Tax=Tardiphaga sp. 839_C3_N1_4 TaxID=3240761 RepID=UPI003F221019
MSRLPDSRFTQWRERAEAVGLLAAAQKFGAKLKKHGAEFQGPCPFCNGVDRFAINLAKGKWHCRGHGGGASVVAMAMHIGGLSFKDAIEVLTGEPPPDGAAKPLTETEKAELNRRRQENADHQHRQQLIEAAYEEETREAASRIWEASKPISGTLAETYLRLFNLPMPPAGWPDVLRFHPSLPYPGKRSMPALVARVDDVAGQLTGVWREYIRNDGRKADVPNQKLGLGPVAGGAVRLGGRAEYIGVAEGVRTAMGAWALSGFEKPVWSCLSTSGLIGFEAPVGVDRIVIYPDADHPMKRQGNKFIAADPAGITAAGAMKRRLCSEGIRTVIAALPPVGKDYLDLWQAQAREQA